MLLGLNCLMQSIAPSASLHYTASLFINNLDLTVYEHVVFVDVEHGIGLEQLQNGVHTLALHRILGHQFALFGNAFLVAESGVAFEV